MVIIAAHINIYQAEPSPLKIINVSKAITHSSPPRFS